MPAFISHYLYGVDLYHNITQDNIKQCLSQHIGAYRLGLQGPDIFFYHPQSMLGPASKNIGSIMHEKNVSKFFCEYISRLSSLDGEKRDIAFSYLCGLFAHNTLDGYVHPYIYYRTNYDPYGQMSTKYFFGMHGELEACIDANLLVRRKSMTPSQFHSSKTLHPSIAEVQVISKLMADCINKTYLASSLYKVYPIHIKEAILCTKLATSVFHSRHGYRMRVLNVIEHFLVHRNVIATTINYDDIPDRFDAMNQAHKLWHNPWNPSLISHDSFDDLYEKAKAKYIEFLPSISQYYNTKYPSKELTQQLVHVIGNTSYHSGLSCIL